MPLLWLGGDVKEKASALDTTSRGSTSDAVTPPLGWSLIYQSVLRCSILGLFTDEQETIDRDDSMRRDNWQALGALLVMTIAIADTALRTSSTLAAIVVGTGALVLLWWYLVKRDRRGD